MATRWPKCSECKLMQSYTRSHATRASCFCSHRAARKTFERLFPRSNKMPGFIGYSAPWGNKPQIKTSPKWCPLRPENMNED